MCHQEEHQSAQAMLVEQNVKTSLNVIAKENDEQWRGVLATLYEHG